MKTLDEIALKCAKCYNTTTAAMQSLAKQKRIVCAKAMFAIFARKEGYTYLEISKFLNLKSHTAAMNLCGVAKRGKTA